MTICDLLSGCQRSKINSCYRSPGPKESIMTFHTYLPLSDGGRNAIDLESCVTSAGTAEGQYK